MFDWARKTFRLSDASLNHDRPRDFAVSRWQRERDAISGAYVAYRFAAAGLFLGALVAAGTTSNYPSFFFIYLTHIGFVTQTAYLILSAALPVQELLTVSRATPITSELTLLAKTTWSLYNITNVTTLIITFIYWGFVFNPAIHRLEPVNITIHAMNTVASIGDIFVSRRPCRLMHFYQPLVFVLSYVVFSIVYWAAGGLSPFGQPYIYAILDWEKPYRTVPLVVFGLMIGMPLIHVFVWMLHHFRDNCLSKMRMKLSSSVEPTKA